MSINLIFVYPNAGELFHPLDVATFTPQEEGWKRAVLEWDRQNSDTARCDPKVLRRVVLKEYCALHLAADTVTM